MVYTAINTVTVEPYTTQTSLAKVRYERETTFANPVATSLSITIEEHLYCCLLQQVRLDVTMTEKRTHPNNT